MDDFHITWKNFEGPLEMKLWVSSTFPFSFHQLVGKGDFHKLLSADLMQVGCERLTSHFIGTGLVEPILNHHIALKLHFLMFNQAWLQVSCQVQYCWRFPILQQQLLCITLRQFKKKKTICTEVIPRLIAMFNHEHLSFACVLGPFSLNIQAILNNSSTRRISFTVFCVCRQRLNTEF